MDRPARASVAAAFPFLALALLVLPASASLVPTTDERVTLYFHGIAPVGNAETGLDFVTESDSPVMDATPPAGAADKTMATSSLGNAAFRKNFLLGYWAGLMDEPARVGNLDATVWMSATAPMIVQATVFGDGGFGVGGAIASATASLPAGDAVALAFDFGDSSANVEEEIVIQFSARQSPIQTDVTPVTPPAVVTILYDSVARPSSLSFDVSPLEVDPPVTWTPAPGWGEVTMISAEFAGRENSLALSPVDPDLMIACAPSGVPSTGFGQSFFHVSRDGGESWDYLEVETSSTDPRRFAFEGGDCDVAFDDAGTMYSADTWLGSLSVGHSKDGGITWAGTSLAASAPVVDRPWIVGQGDGILHVTWQDVQFGMPSAIWYARSTDHGLTFTPATSVTTANRQGAFTWTGNLAVSEDGQSLYSVYTRRGGPAVGSLDDTGPETVWVAKSVDAGLTWTQHLVASMPNPASFLYPSLAMDDGGILHVVFSSRSADGSDRPIWYARSTDAAQTWSAPMKTLAGVSGWSPWVVGGAAGEASIHWYGTKEHNGTTAATFGWYFYAAKVTNGVVTSAGPTTVEPIFEGVQSAVPEFNQLRLDGAGRIHIGAAAFHDAGGGADWVLFHQREV